MYNPKNNVESRQMLAALHKAVGAIHQSPVLWSRVIEALGEVSPDLHNALMKAPERYRNGAFVGGLTGDFAPVHPDDFGARVEYIARQSNERCEREKAE